jgi:hypothetical protein
MHSTCDPQTIQQGHHSGENTIHFYLILMWKMPVDSNPTSLGVLRMQGKVFHMSACYCLLHRAFTTNQAPFCDATCKEYCRFDHRHDHTNACKDHFQYKLMSDLCTQQTTFCGNTPRHVATQARQHPVSTSIGLPKVGTLSVNHSSTHVMKPWPSLGLDTQPQLPSAKLLHLQSASSHPLRWFNHRDIACEPSAQRSF